MTLVSGCVNIAEPENFPEPDRPLTILEQEPEDHENVDSTIDEEAEKKILFDFGELSEDGFPRGEWSINQLINRYGSYENIKSVRIIADNDNALPPLTDIVIIDVYFEDVFVRFAGIDTTYFYYYKEVQELVEYYYEEDFPLNEADKNIELEIVQLIIYDAQIEFPRGIKIGQSIKSDILAAYPEGSAYINKYDVCFDYDFLDGSGSLPEWNPHPQAHGFVRYEFDDAYILKSVEIVWRWYGS